MKEKTWFDIWIDKEYEKLCKKIYNEIWRQLDLENTIDNILLSKYPDEGWFKIYKLEPYLQERFRYHISWNSINMTMTKMK